ncbi:MAG: hypothetical protein V3S12_03920 [Acidiferrobacterales bacterium]
MLRQRLFTTLIVIITTLLPIPATAEYFIAQRPPLVLAKSSGMSLEQAAAKVRRQTGGRILSASVSRRGNQKIYRIKVLLPSGNIRVITINASGN